MKNVSIARLEAYKNETIMLIAPKEMLNDFLVYLGNVTAEAQENATQNKRPNTADDYRRFFNQIHEQLNNKED